MTRPRAEPERMTAPPASGRSSRWTVRAALVLGLLLLVLSWRLDAAVEVAYESDWSASRLERESGSGCAECRLRDGLRLPYVLAGAAGLVSLLVAAVRHAGRGRPGRRRGWLRAAAALTTGLAVAGIAVRYAAVENAGAGFVTAGYVIDAVALAVLALTALAVANAERPSVSGPSALAVVRLRGFLQRERLNLIGVLAYAAVLTLVPQTSGQAIDSMRGWGVSNGDELARLALGLASALVLALVVYESALRLTQATRSADAKPVRARYWFGAFGVLLVLGVVVWALVGARWGLFVLALVPLVLGFFEVLRIERPREPIASPPPDEHAPEYLAIIPLLAIGAISVAAFVDSALAGSNLGGSLELLIPAFASGLLAVAMTSETDPPTLQQPSLGSWQVAFALGLVVALAFAWQARSSTTAATIGLAAFAGLVSYTLWVFRSRRTVVERGVFVLPVALGIGLALVIAVHFDEQRVGSTLGVFTLVNVALAAALSGLHFLVRGSIAVPPPRALTWFQIHQLPTLSILVVVWALAGLGGASFHTARLVDRDPAADPRAVPPTLLQAFREWTRAQPELAVKETDERPYPLVVVASHGGGIRAAYWTALALDCIVGADAQPAPGGMTDASTVYRSTCEADRRRLEGQRRAARRIFLASGVSGGAVGLYAYGRQLLSSHGGLGSADWVSARLGNDFASPSVGWALFHDALNHFIGIRPKNDGSCAKRASLGDERCLSNDRAVVLENSFDQAWGEADAPLLRKTWEDRTSSDKGRAQAAKSVPLLVTNATVTGGGTRALISAADMAAWPRLEAAVGVRVPALGSDPRPVAGTAEVAAALCQSKDIRLSTAALLGARFPYVSPSGHINGGCRDENNQADRDSDCANVPASICEIDLVDGGYTDNSGLFTVAAIWPALKHLIVGYNARENTHRDIALVIVELDNHYRAQETRPPQAGKSPGQTLAPIVTALGGRQAIETYARAIAYRLTPFTCTVTILPGLHPGVSAPLGWELSQGAQDDLKEALVRPYGKNVRPRQTVARVQSWLGDSPDWDALRECVPEP